MWGDSSRRATWCPLMSCVVLHPYKPLVVWIQMLAAPSLGNVTCCGDSFSKMHLCWEAKSRACGVLALRERGRQWGNGRGKYGPAGGMGQGEGAGGLSSGESLRCGYKGGLEGCKGYLGHTEPNKVPNKVASKVPITLLSTQGFGVRQQLWQPWWGCGAGLKAGNTTPFPMPWIFVTKCLLQYVCKQDKYG